MSTATIPPKPTAPAPILTTIPTDLACGAAWVCWRYEWRDGKGGKPGKWTKIPVDPRTGTNASSTDEKTWGTVAECMKLYKAGQCDGIGRIITPGYTGIDLDGCAEGDVIDPAALAVIGCFDSFSEMSVSGTGVHIWIKGTLSPEYDRCRTSKGGKFGKVEIYRGGDGRFFTVTGAALDIASPTVRTAGEELRAFYLEVFGAPEKKAAEPRAAKSTAATPDEQKVIDKLCTDSARAALWNGSIAAYGDDHSAADQALCNHLAFWCGNDRGLMDRLFRRSGLFREKWDERRGAKLYGEMTIDNAIAGCRDPYDWSRSNGNGTGRQNDPEPYYPPAPEWEDEGGMTSPEAEPSRMPALTKVSSVETKPVTWLWDQRIAQGKITLLCGDPGRGKSFVSMDIAARVSTGSPWPDGAPGCERGSVILLNAEDDTADTIRPRLETAHADLDRIVVMDGISFKADDGTRRIQSFTLEHVAMLEDAIKKVGDVRLVVIDPVSAYLSDKDSHNNAEIRGLLAPLARVASEYGVAVLIVTHLSKGGGGRAMYRAMGSLAFVAAARAAWIIVDDKDTPTRRLFLPIKNNLGQDQSGLAYSLLDGGVAWERDAVTITADDALAQQEKVEERDGAMGDAARFLTNLLSKYPLSAKEVFEAADGAGVSKAAINRAKKALGIDPYKERCPPYRWMWRLPQKGEGAQPTPPPPHHGVLDHLDHLAPQDDQDKQDDHDICHGVTVSIFPPDAQNEGGMRHE